MCTQAQEAKYSRSAKNPIIFPPIHCWRVRSRSSVVLFSTSAFKRPPTALSALSLVISRVFDLVMNVAVFGSSRTLCFFCHVISIHGRVQHGYLKIMGSRKSSAGEWPVHRDCTRAPFSSSTQYLSRTSSCLAFGGPVRTFVKHDNEAAFVYAWDELPSNV